MSADVVSVLKFITSRPELWRRAVYKLFMSNVRRVAEQHECTQIYVQP